jgi:hypothetical protein
MTTTEKKYKNGEDEKFLIYFFIAALQLCYKQNMTPIPTFYFSDMFLWIVLLPSNAIKDEKEIWKNNI